MIIKTKNEIFNPLSRENSLQMAKTTVANNAFVMLFFCDFSLNLLIKPLYQYSKFTIHKNYFCCWLLKNPLLTERNNCVEY